MFSKILFIPKRDVDHAPSPDNPEKLDLPHFYLLSSVSEMAIFSKGLQGARGKKRTSTPFESSDLLVSGLVNILTITLIRRWNIHGYLSVELWVRDNAQGQISEHMFASNGGYGVHYPSNSFRNTRSFENWGISLRYSPWGKLSHVTRLNQSRASETIWWIMRKPVSHIDTTKSQQNCSWKRGIGAAGTKWWFKNRPATYVTWLIQDIASYGA